MCNNWKLKNTLLFSSIHHKNGLYFKMFSFCHNSLKMVIFLSALWQQHAALWLPLLLMRHQLSVCSHRVICFLFLTTIKILYLPMHLGDISLSLSCLNFLIQMIQVSHQFWKKYQSLSLQLLPLPQFFYHLLLELWLDVILELLNLSSMHLNLYIFFMSLWVSCGQFL